MSGDMTSAHSRAVGTAKAGEENNLSNDIDLIEVARFLWQLRKYAVVGLAVGLVAGWLVASLMVTPHYLSKISVTIDSKSLPAIVDPGKVTESVSSALASPEIAYRAFDAFAKSAPNFVSNLNKSGLFISDLALQQTGVERAEDGPLSVSPSTSNMDFFVKVKMPVNGLGRDLAPAITEALRVVAKEANARVITLKKDASLSQLEDASETYRQTESAYDKKRLSRESDMTQVKMELAQLEYRLFKKARASGVDLAKFLALGDIGGSNFPLNMKHMISSASALNNAMLQIDEEDTALTVDRVLRIVAILSEENKLSKAEASSIHQALATLQLRNAKSESSYSASRFATKTALVGLLAATEKAVTSVDRASFFLPSFIVNQQVFDASLKAKGFEQKYPRRFLWALSGGIAGVILSIICGTVFVFFSSNRSRIFQQANSRHL